MPKVINLSFLINAPIEEVWKGLTDPKYIDAWGGGPAKMDDLVGTEFTLWGGSIHGKNIEVIKNQKLVQEWFSDDGAEWKIPSLATFTLTQEEDGVRLTLSHENVPEESIKGIKDGWEEFYLGPMKEYLQEDLTPVHSIESR